jgi:hypothetical protein
VVIQHVHVEVVACLLGDDLHVDQRPEDKYTLALGHGVLVEECQRPSPVAEEGMHCCTATAGPLANIR